MYWKYKFTDLCALLQNLLCMYRFVYTLSNLSVHLQICVQKVIKLVMHLHIRVYTLTNFSRRFVQWKYPFTDFCAHYQILYIHRFVYKFIKVGMHLHTGVHNTASIISHRMHKEEKCTGLQQIIFVPTFYNSVLLIKRATFFGRLILSKKLFIIFNQRFVSV